VRTIELIERFKFYHKVNRDRIYTCKSLDNKFIVMWEIDGRLDCTDYLINEVTDNLQDGTWIVVN
jgi:hypothetical protein